MISLMIVSIVLVIAGYVVKDFSLEDRGMILALCVLSDLHLWIHACSEIKTSLSEKGE